MLDPLIKDLLKLIFSNPYILLIIFALISAIVLLITSGYESDQKERLKLLIPGITLFILVLIVVIIAPTYFLFKTAGII